MKKNLLFFILLGFFLFLDSFNVKAMDVDTWYYGEYTDVIDNLTQSKTYNFSNSIFSNQGPGVLSFSLNVNKVSGSSTSSIVSVRSIDVYSNNGRNYPCLIGSSSVNNSTFNSTTYSAQCNMSMGSTGLEKVVVYFTDFQSNESSSYRLTLHGNFSYTSNISASLNVDTSGTTNAINGQITNDNANTNRIIDSQNQTKQSIDTTNNILNNDDTSASQNQASNFFGNFSSNSHGLSGIISAPLRLIRSLSSDTCNPLSFPLPFVQQNVTLPCMSSIYSTYFGAFFTLYQLITTGLIGYWVVIKLFGHVKNLQDPNKDKIEVFEL